MPTMKQYVEHIERGLSTHATCARICSEQVLEAEGKGEMAVARQRDLESAVHTLGLTVGIAALAILEALGQEVPEAPPLTELH